MLVFHLERQGHIDMWRVLHTWLDIPARMCNPDTF